MLRIRNLCAAIDGKEILRGLNLDVNTDNTRAISFYEKVGFVVTGNGFNAFSGRPVHHMSWRPNPAR